jgi:hypothetical protein
MSTISEVLGPFPSNNNDNGSKRIFPSITDNRRLNFKYFPEMSRFTTSAAGKALEAHFRREDVSFAIIHSA